MFRDRYSTRYEQPDMEERFRRVTFHRDMLRARLITILALVPIGSYLVWGLVTFGFETILTAKQMGRIMITVLSFVTLWTIHRRPDFRTFDKIMSIWLMGLTVSVLIVCFFRPADSITGLAWDVITILAIYTFVPLILDIQVLAVGLIVVTNLIIWVFFKKPAGGSSTTIWVSMIFLFTGVCGYILSLELHRSRRRRFWLLEEEKKMNTELKKALDEIKTLQGILPICATCKKIRDDKGHWIQIESFIGKHSGAEFSHSICPECTKKFYPGLDTPKEK